MNKDSYLGAMLHEIYVNRATLIPLLIAAVLYIAIFLFAGITASNVEVKTGGQKAQQIEQVQAWLHQR